MIRLKWIAAAGLLVSLRADTVTLASGSNYVTTDANNGLTITTSAAKADTFERLYAGNGYFYLRVNRAAWVVTDPGNDSLAISAVNTATAEQFKTIPASGSSVDLMARSTSGYIQVAGSKLLANVSATDASAFAITAAPDTAPSVEVDFANPRQTIAGFGAADAFYSNWLSAHPNKEQIYELLFGRENLGASVLRLQNIYGQQQTPASPFDPDAAEVVAKANQYRGSPIAVLMTSWSPPGSLKASGQVSCNGNPVEPGCTLVKVNGSYNYSGFAQYWRDSLDAYAGLGVVPTYISLQNEPDFTPSGYAGCRFDPAEQPSGIYAGYKEALDAAWTTLQTMAHPPTLVGPEVVGLGYNGIENYLSALDAGELAHMGAVAHHLYGGDSGAPDSFNAGMLELVAAAPSKQLFETEFDHSSDQTSAMDTAWLIHNAMAVEEDSMYLYWSYFWPDANQLIYIDNPFTPSSWTYPQTGFHITDYYYALQHFSRFVQPGFQRIASVTGLAELRATAYTNRQARRLVFVLINTSDTDTLTPTLAFPELVRRGHAGTAVYRSTFSGTDERFASLGPLPPSNVVTLPPQAVATVVVDDVFPDCARDSSLCRVPAVRGR